MPRLILPFLLCACACICFAIKGANPTPTPSPATAATDSPQAELKNAPTPSKETLASAPAGYLDLPVKAKIGYSSVHVDGPYIAMTFDDGPSATLTPKLLDLLKAKGIKATFFVIGQNAEAHPEILKRAIAEGHEIGNHTWTHPVLSKLSDDAVRQELQKTQDAIVAAIGKKPTLMRPPYGAITKEQKDWIHKEFGYEIILWDVDPNDWKIIKGETTAERTARVENVILNGDKDGPGATPGSIILSHDIHATTIDAMPDTFDKLLAKGFKFVTVSQLIAMEKPLPPKPSASPAKKEPAVKSSPAVQ
ncbi:MAG TPA: polysaccharide deacetylase family protein [Chthoniobacteraceae bacterium]|nr:polysaccharide deacetylase family protein [Chthoniobacteraceae bacterium]